MDGEIDVRGAKNAAFPLLAASILTKENVLIDNLPRIEDVFRMIEILKSMNARVDWLGERTIRINTKALDPAKIDKVLVKRLRGSILFLGPLLARFGKIYLPQPGGCVIGARPIDTHLDAFRQIGAVIVPKKEGFEVELKTRPRKQMEVILNEFSVTATENVLLFAALISVPVILKIADFDYQVQELIRVLTKMGASVEMIGLHTLKITGRKSLRGFEHRLLYDPTEAGTFILMAAALRGEITIANVELSFLDLFLKRLKDFGVNVEVISQKNGVGTVRVSPSKNVHIGKIQYFIYPGIHSDLQSPFGVLATQTKGSTLLHDPLYEGRLKYLEELNKMGAEIYLTDPHRAIINGPTKLYGAEITASDLRGGAALITAALIAKGQSAISNVYQIDRGYEEIEKRIQKLGGDIQRVEE